MDNERCLYQARPNVGRLLGGVMRMGALLVTVVVLGGGSLLPRGGSTRSCLLLSLSFWRHCDVVSTRVSSPLYTADLRDVMYVYTLAS